MNQLNSTTQRQKGKHLSFKERVIIQTRLNDKHSPNKIATELCCSPNTIRNEIKRGTVYLVIDAIERIEDWCNNLPRKILGYKTPDELFEAKLDEIYSA